MKVQSHDDVDRKVHRTGSDYQQVHLLQMKLETQVPATEGKRIVPCTSSRSLSPEENDILFRHTRQYPVKVGGLARDLGVAVKISNLDPGISGQVTKEDGRYIIRVTRPESRERQRLTIAHELAHFLLHRDILDTLTGGIIDNILYQSGQPREIEVEANLLAHEIVLPSALIYQRLQSVELPITEDNILALAEEFEVTRGLMYVRLQYLGYKSLMESGQFYQSIRKNLYLLRD